MGIGTTIVSTLRPQGGHLELITHQRAGLGLEYLGRVSNCCYYYYYSTTAPGEALLRLEARASGSTRATHRRVVRVGAGI